MAADQHDLEGLDTAVDPSPNFDYMYKIVLVGDSGVGKTSLLDRYIDNKFSPTFVATLGIDFNEKSIFREDKCIKLHIWDTSGEEEYRTITTVYYRGAMGFVLMFDLTSEKSFHAVKEWSSIIWNLPWKVQLVLIGNKSDLSESRIITNQQGMDLAESMGVHYFETSAKDDINVKQTFETLIDLISEKMVEIVQKESLSQAEGT